MLVFPVGYLLLCLGGFAISGGLGIGTPLSILIVSSFLFLLTIILLIYQRSPISMLFKIFHSAPSLLEISELCILGFSCAIFRRCPLDQTMNAFMGRLMWSFPLPGLMLNLRKQIEGIECKMLKGVSHSLRENHIFFTYNKECRDIYI